MTSRRVRLAPWLVLVAMIAAVVLAFGCNRADRAQDGHTGSSAPSPSLSPAAEVQPRAEVSPAPGAGVPLQPVRRVAIEVGAHGYQPNTLTAAASEQLVLVFTRTADTECGRYVSVATANTKVELPLNQPVEVLVSMPAKGELIFACGMDMMHGIITIK